MTFDFIYPHWKYGKFWICIVKGKSVWTILETWARQQLHHIHQHKIQFSCIFSIHKNWVTCIQLPEHTRQYNAHIGYDSIGFEEILLRFVPHDWLGSLLSTIFLCCFDRNINPHIENGSLRSNWRKVRWFNWYSPRAYLQFFFLQSMLCYEHRSLCHYY